MLADPGIVQSRSAAQERQRPDPDRHQAADAAHHGQERFAADPRRDRDAAEHEREQQAIAASPIRSMIGRGSRGGPSAGWTGSAISRPCR